MGTRPGQIAVTQGAKDPVRNPSTGKGESVQDDANQRHLVSLPYLRGLGGRVQWKQRSTWNPVRDL